MTSLLIGCGDVDEADNLATLSVTARDPVTGTPIIERSALLRKDGCESDHAASPIIRGQQKPFDSGTVAAWAELTRGGIVNKVGVTLSAAALRDMITATTVSVLLPGRVRHTTSINHAEIGFNPAGHLPPPYLVSHFDVHFYGLTRLFTRFGSRIERCSRAHSMSRDVLPQWFCVARTS